MVKPERAPTLNAMALNLGPSPTMAGAASPCRHPDPVDLSVGEPDGLPPESAREAAARAAREGLARYGPAAGVPELRARVAQDLSARDGIPRSAEHIILTAGGKAALHDALRCLLEPGDEVVIFAPYWPTFRDQILWNGGVPVIVPAGEDLLPSQEALVAAVGPRTRAVILNQPSNPTGCIWDGPRIQCLAALAQRYGVWLIIDQVYGTLSLGGPEVPFLRHAPEVADQCVVVESFSKRFAMTGYRLGAAAAPPALIKAMTALASSTVTHPCMLSQHAGLAALSLDGRWERGLVRDLRTRRDLAWAGLEGLSGLRVHRPQGAMYLFPDVRAWMANRALGSDRELVQRLRDEAGVKVLPGTAFGAPGHLRLSFAAPQAALEVAITRLRAFFQVRP